MTHHQYFIGQMSGTSMDGVDAVLVKITPHTRKLEVLDSASTPYTDDLRTQLLAMQSISSNELHQAAKLGNQLAKLYAENIQSLLARTDLPASQIKAIACHGQTIRHAPEHGYSCQIGNLALLAEHTGINVIGDFRSRDIAAGGQGAPLVPAFHDFLFGCQHECRAILNIGGIANLTALNPNERVIGFDTGPGNMLMDEWIYQHHQVRFDCNGDWAASGIIHDALLQQMLDDPYFALPPPKSSGRDRFNLTWLNQQLASYPGLSPADIQATLLALTSESIANALQTFLPNTQTLYLCGGGAYNETLVRHLGQRLSSIAIKQTDQLGIPAQQVEAAAFAWLGYCFMHQLTANLPTVTGAQGKRILGALYPA